LFGSLIRFPDKCSPRFKRKRADWDENVRMNMVGLKQL